MTYRRVDGVDPGPVPAVVEPETFGNATTIVVSPRAQVRVTADVGRTGLVGLTVETAGGDSVTVALPPPCVDAVLEALAAAAPVPYLPPLPQVQVFTAPAGPAGAPAGGGR
ncbi:MAG: hypothetical protein ACRDT2_07735 [Natronosporangium sp.]